MSIHSIDVIDHAESPRPARPAATAVLLREGAEGPEVLMVRRSSKTAFGGMWAFPGGVIEDRDVPAGTPPDPLPAARVAAVRETREEVGLDVDLASLVWLSHWLPPAESPKRFSTWFFVAPTPAGTVEVDGAEVHDHRWMRPADALRLRDSGEIQLVTPTFVTLHGLLSTTSVADALDVGEPYHYATRRAVTADGVHVCLYDGDVGYATGNADEDGPMHRLVMDEERGWDWVDTR